MVPSADNVIELVELYLVESEGAGWSKQHVMETVRAHGMTAVAAGGHTPRETKAARGAVPLLHDYTRPAKVAQRMLDTIESINPRLRRALELRAASRNLDCVGARLGISRQRAAALVDQAVVAGQVYLVTR